MKHPIYENKHNQLCYMGKRRENLWLMFS